MVCCGGRKQRKREEGRGGREDEAVRGGGGRKLEVPDCGEKRASPFLHLFGAQGGDEGGDGKEGGGARTTAAKKLKIKYKSRKR